MISSLESVPFQSVSGLDSQNAYTRRSSDKMSLMQMNGSRGSSSVSIKIKIPRLLEQRLHFQHVTKQLRSYCAKGGGAAASKALAGAETNGRMQGNLRDSANLWQSTKEVGREVGV